MLIDVYHVRVRAGGSLLFGVTTCCVQVGQIRQCVFGVRAGRTCFEFVCFVDVSCPLPLDMDAFPDVVPAQFHDVPPLEEIDFVPDPADFKLMSPLHPESDSDSAADISLDKPSMLNATLRHIDFKPDSE